MFKILKNLMSIQIENLGGPDLKAFFKIWENKKKPFFNY